VNEVVAANPDRAKSTFSRAFDPSSIIRDPPFEFMGRPVDLHEQLIAQPCSIDLDVPTVVEFDRAVGDGGRDSRASNQPHESAFEVAPGSGAPRRVHVQRLVQPFAPRPMEVTGSDAAGDTRVHAAPVAGFVHVVRELVLALEVVRQVH